MPRQSCRRAISRSLALASLLFVAACSEGEVDDAAEPEGATGNGEAGAMQQGIAPIDFADLDLGPKIEGPQGPEVTASLSNDSGVLADITSYVACPSGVETCDPATAPLGTIYTYVHVVAAREGMGSGAGAGEGPDDADIGPATTFFMDAPAHGFMGHAGFSRAEALSATGSAVEVAITCDDSGALSWTVNAGDGGNQWEDGEPITFFWQSTLPPAGPAPAYRIRLNDVTAIGEGPFPAADAQAINLCFHSDLEMPVREQSPNTNDIAALRP